MLEIDFLKTALLIIIAFKMAFIIKSNANNRHQLGTTLLLPVFAFFALNHDQSDLTFQYMITFFLFLSLMSKKKAR